MIADGRHSGGRHRRGPVTGHKAASKLAGWHRIAAAGIGTGIAAVSFLALSSPAGAAQPLAKAKLVDATGTQIGQVTFKGMGKYAERIKVDINAPNALNLVGFHALHIHTIGTCVAPFTSAGGHLNPDNAVHGAHEGDLPSVLLTPDGQASAEFETARINIESLFDADGSAVVLHQGPDNFANIPPRYQFIDPTSGPVAGPDATTSSTGDAGGRYACGVVEPTN